MDPFIISSLEEIDIVAMGISDQEHIKATSTCAALLFTSGSAAADSLSLSLLAPLQAVCKAVQDVKTEGLTSSQGFSLSSRADPEVSRLGFILHISC
jgi:hypothetical protein